MDTWSTLILCHPQLKMSATQRVAFSLDHDRPLYIIGFAGAVAERHVENLKIMRIVGSRKYAEACRELTSE
jgi:hypothetical protein